MPGICPKWGDGSKWGDGDLWCSISGSFPYIAWADGRPGILAEWNLVSPDGTFWTPTISTTGLVTFTSGGTGPATEVPCVPSSSDGVSWAPSISDSGVVTLTSSVDTGAPQAVLIDADSVYWYWLVLTPTSSLWANSQLTGSAIKAHHVSVDAHGPGGDIFIIDSVRLLVQVAAQNLSTMTAHMDFSTLTRLSLQVQHAGGALLVVTDLVLLANVKKHQPKG